MVQLMLAVQAVQSFKTSGTAHSTIQFHVPEYLNLQQHQCDPQILQKLPNFALFSFSQYTMTRACPFNFPVLLSTKLYHHQLMWMR